MSTLCTPWLVIALVVLIHSINSTFDVLPRTLTASERICTGVGCARVVPFEEVPLEDATGGPGSGRTGLMDAATLLFRTVDGLGVDGSFANAAGICRLVGCRYAAISRALFLRK